MWWDFSLAIIMLSLTLSSALLQSKYISYTWKILEKANIIKSSNMTRLAEVKGPLVKPCCSRIKTEEIRTFSLSSTMVFI